MKKDSRFKRKMAIKKNRFMKKEANSTDKPSNEPIDNPVNKTSKKTPKKQKTKSKRPKGQEKQLKQSEKTIFAESIESNV